MRWWLIPAVATLPLLTIACSDSPPDVTPEQANTRTVVLTYFTIPG